jgi:crossover junction endodeoxyribonuclease RuvC
MKYFLGIDPGLSEVGFGIISAENNRIEFVECGIIKTHPENTFSERLKIIKDDLTEILKSHKFSAVGVEELFFCKNVTNAIKVAHARGVILETIFEFQISSFEFTPLQVKSNICGYGKADKVQVQDMVKRTLNLNARPKPYDAADALAIAICTAYACK